MPAIIKEFELDMQTFVGSYFALDDKENLVLPVKFTFYRGEVDSLSDGERFFLSVYGVDNYNEQYFISEFMYELPQEAVKTDIRLSQRLLLPKDFIEEKDILNLTISLAITSKHPGEMGLGESLRVGAFFEASINLRNLPKEIDGE